MKTNKFIQLVAILVLLLGVIQMAGPIHSVQSWFWRGR